MLNVIATGSTGQVFNEMCRFKDKGEPVHLAVMKIVPKEERLPALAEMYGTDKIAAVLSKAITKELSYFNLRVGMTAEQIMELSFALIEDAKSDNLALQDIMLFLDGFAKFKYGKVYDRMDQPTFFEMLEVYREKRHQSLMELREEQNAQYKAMGDSNRSSLDTDKEANRNAMNEYLKQQYK